jgi:hypothetical protein
MGFKLTKVDQKRFRTAKLVSCMKNITRKSKKFLPKNILQQYRTVDKFYRGDCRHRRA